MGVMDRMKLVLFMSFVLLSHRYLAPKSPRVPIGFFYLAPCI